MDGTTDTLGEESPIAAMQAMMKTMMAAMTEQQKLMATQQNNLIESLAARQSRDNASRLEAEKEISKLLDA